jgi:hypothetical protein
MPYSETAFSTGGNSLLMARRSFSPTQMSLWKMRGLRMGQDSFMKYLCVYFTIANYMWFKTFWGSPEGISTLNILESLRNQL